MFNQSEAITQSSDRRHQLTSRPLQIGALVLALALTACGTAPASPAAFIAPPADAFDYSASSSAVRAPASDASESFGQIAAGNPLGGQEEQAVAIAVDGKQGGATPLAKYTNSILGSPVVVAGLPWGKCLRVFSQPSRYAPSKEVGCAVNGQQGTIIRSDKIWAEGTTWVAVEYPVPYSVNRAGVIRAWSDASYIHFR